MTISLRPARDADFPHIYSLFQHILTDGTTYSYDPSEMTESRSRDYWMNAEGTRCIVAEDGGKFAGCYALRPNRTGRAGHVANASYIVHPSHRNKGVGRQLGEHSLKLAKELGYHSIQFNFVVSANEVAVKLWKSLGFKVVGTLPQGFKHDHHGMVDVLILHRNL